MPYISSIEIETVTNKTKTMFLPDFTSDNRKENNISTAKAILENAGVKDFYFDGYSESNGVSVYFRNEADQKIRVSNHGVTNRFRMAEELQFEFDAKTAGIGGKTGVKDNQKINKKTFELYTRTGKIIS